MKLPFNLSIKENSSSITISPFPRLIHESVLIYKLIITWQRKSKAELIWKVLTFQMLFYALWILWSPKQFICPFKHLFFLLFVGVFISLFCILHRRCSWQAWDLRFYGLVPRRISFKQSSLDYPVVKYCSSICSWVACFVVKKQMALRINLPQCKRCNVWVFSSFSCHKRSEKICCQSQ